MKISLRVNLTASFLAVIIICGLAATLVAIRLIGTGIISQAQERVRTDLNAARHLYQDEVQEVKALLGLSAQRFFIKDALLENDLEKLKRELEQIRKRKSLDILTLTDRNGRVVVRAQNPSVSGDDQAQDEFVGLVLSSREVIAGTAIVPREELEKEKAELAEQAHIRLVPTVRAKPSPETEQTSGMVVKAAAPVFGYDGNLVGVLYGGNLLNRNYKIVDKVKEIVYQEVKYKGKDIGTATIFQGDLRVSTNVEAEDGSRAIGTRVSEEVYEQVLVKGLPWIHRAFVVNDWYIAAYVPIKDIKGKIIGILYVGILEEKFIDMQKKATAIFFGITLAGMIIALIVSSFLTKAVLEPIKSLVCASNEWAKGNLDYRVKMARRDEIGQLGETFNRMASSLKDRDQKLEEYTSQQIMKSERLATLGQLAAGVAHEINNPLGAVMMYMQLGLEDSEDKPTLRRNLQKAVGEASRCKDIVRGLLDFARQTEPKIENSDINTILERTLALFRDQALFQDVKLTKVFCPSLPEVPVDVGQVQQVFANMVINAAEAMEGKGELKVTTRMIPNHDYIEIEFTDTGWGIPVEDHEKVFEPFFTTKEVGRGTGLGLSISHGIVARHKGSIEVKSGRGRGTSFIIKLPLSRKDE